MANATYLAIVERAGAGYSVFFPDLPGCTSAGATLQEVVTNAEEALAGHLILSAEMGAEIPAPSALDEIARDPDVDEAARLLVTAMLPGKSVRVNITMDEGLIDAIDRVTNNRSGWLAEAARARLMARAA